GAGKTFLMSAIIYLNLYFALKDPDAKEFAHNFLILAPSGLKSSIVPSLKHIVEFDPTWVIPDPAASQIKRIISFEVLDESKSARKSNITRNPNARKISTHQPFDTLMGLVAVTNAEKVILNKMDKTEDRGVLDTMDLQEIKQANELREIIGRIPNLAVIIDEVHHATDSEIKLRKVVTEWGKLNSFNSILGFSGTPYLEKAENVPLANGLSIKNTDITNVVYHYPLIEGVGNFLKRPVIRFADNEQTEIIRNGVIDFMNSYKDTEYPNGTCAKLAIYCGKIENLEEVVYPLVTQIVSSLGLNPTEAILKYHGGNKSYPVPEGSEVSFSTLDKPFSKVRIVLLVQIGKEGWDCRSLTGVILPQKGVCPTNMVLQTSCRCLREVQHNADETAIIWLNKFNADTLNKQLKQQQNITLEELRKAGEKSWHTIRRVSRMDVLKLPEISYNQFRISYVNEVVENQADTQKRLEPESILIYAKDSLIHEQDLTGKILSVSKNSEASVEQTSFNDWVYKIHKESFGTLTMDGLYRHRDSLERIFESITIPYGTYSAFNPEYDQEAIRSAIRQVFVPLRTLRVYEEVVPEEAELLRIDNLHDAVNASDSDIYYPDAEAVEEILAEDKKPAPPELSPQEKAAMELLAKRGIVMSDLSEKHPERNQTYHYLPYHFDSGLEKSVFTKELLPLIKEKKIEVYFNGDDTLTEFKINCYRKSGEKWEYLGKYIPDFLMISRTTEGNIHKVAIIETKGEGFASKFNDRKHFMEKYFIPMNNSEFGYDKFRFVYLEDTLGSDSRLSLLNKTISEFFRD
ncbi:MAG TPA: restriction endonuclease subunit R, partial [Rikenellaceae bacterium]|nr:restriction endonuclease subunit R [Rikenellaceae bacterium]